MAIKTDSNKTVYILEMPDTTYKAWLNAFIGATNGVAAVNSARVLYLGLSSTDPRTSVSEPTDSNYKRIKIAENGNSDYLHLTDDGTLVNDGHNEIKFQRSTEAWEGQYGWFTLHSAATNGVLLAWGRLKNAIVVDRADQVPLFEENKFAIHFGNAASTEEFADAG